MLCFVYAGFLLEKWVFNQLNVNISSDRAIVRQTSDPSVQFQNPSRQLFSLLKTRIVLFN